MRIKLGRSQSTVVVDRAYKEDEEDKYPSFYSGTFFEQAISDFMGRETSMELMVEIRISEVK